MTEEHVNFDPLIIQEFADRLYAQADSIVARSTVLAGLMGAAVGYVISVVSHESAQTSNTVSVCAAIAAVLGYFRGREKAFKLRLEAQLALCQIYTERNTRVAASAVPRTSPSEAGTPRSAQRLGGA